MDGYDAPLPSGALAVAVCARRAPCGCHTMGALIICRSQRSLLKPDLVFDLFVVHWMHIAETIYRSNRAPPTMRPSPV